MLIGSRGTDAQELERLERLGDVPLPAVLDPDRVGVEGFWLSSGSAEGLAGRQVHT